jgi:hypothetical protein
MRARHTLSRGALVQVYTAPLAHANIYRLSFDLQAEEAAEAAAAVRVS